MLALGEGDTPLLPAHRLGADMGLSRLFIKEEGRNPTGSFKARGLAAAVSKAKELGIHKLIIPTAGNARRRNGSLCGAGRVGCLCLYARRFTPIEYRRMPYLRGGGSPGKRLALAMLPD